MPKKTKKQKLKADRHSQPNAATRPISPSEVAPAETVPSLSVFSFRKTSHSPTAAPTGTHAIPLDARELAGIRADLMRTVLLAAVILAAELGLAYFLGR